MNIILNNGSTGVACVNLNRDFIGIELDEGYFKIAEKRIKEAQSQGGCFDLPADAESEEEQV